MMRRREVLSAPRVDDFTERERSPSSARQEGGIPAVTDEVRDFSVVCPLCDRVYAVKSIVPKRAKQATVVCDCGQAMEIYPTRFWGWRYTRVEARV